MLRILCRLARPAGESRARQLSLGQSQQKAAAKEDYGLAARALIPTSSSVAGDLRRLERERDVRKSCSAGAGGEGATLRRRGVVVRGEHLGFWRGYAGTGKRSGGYAHRLSFQQITKEIKEAQGLGDLLKLVDAHGAKFNFINVSTAVSTVSKLASKHAMQVGKVQVGKVLCEHDGFVKLIALVTLHCGDFEAQAVGNVLNGLAVLQTDLGVKSVDDKVALQLVCVVESTARTMNAQGIAVTLNAMCKLEAVAGVMSPSGWDAVARAVESTALTMNEQGVGMTLNAMCKLEAAADAMSPAGWDAVARAVESTAPTMTSKGVANTLNAMCKLEAAAGAMLPSGWDAMARAVEISAPTMSEQGVGMTLKAMCKREAAAGAMSPAGWDAVARAVESTAPMMKANNVGLTLNALGKLEAAAGAMSRAGWVSVARAVESKAPAMTSQGVSMTLCMLGELEAAAGAMSPSGWDAVARAVESTAWDAQDAGLTLNALRKLEATAGAMSPSGRGRVSGDDRSSGMGGGRGGGRGRGGGTDSSRGGGRGGDFAKLLPLLTDAEYPEDILIIVRPYMDEVESPQLLNHKEVARAFQMLGRLAKWEHQGPLYLLSSRTFRALLRIAKDFADSGKFNRTTIMVAVAGITDLHVKHQVRAGNTVVDDTLSALEAALGRL